MRGRITAAVAIATAFGLVACLQAASQTAPAPLAFTVARANATATLIFHRTDAEGLTNDTGRVTLTVKKSAVGKGMLSKRGGSVTVPIRETIGERVRLKRKTGESAYLVTTCKQTTNQKTRGKLKLRRSGANVLVRWAFPQAQTRFCPGPKVGSSLTGLQTALYRSSRFSSRRVIVVIVGSQAVDTPLLQATYRWRLTVLLERSA